MRIIAVAVRQLPYFGAVRAHGVDVVVAVAKTAKHDAIASRRPRRKRVVLIRESRDFAVVESENAKPLLPVSHHPVDEPFAVRRPARKAAAGLPVSKHPQTRPIRPDQRQLSWHDRPLKEAADPKHDGLAIRCPRGESNRLAT